MNAAQAQAIVQIFVDVGWSGGAQIAWLGGTVTLPLWEYLALVRYPWWLVMSGIKAAVPQRVLYNSSIESLTVISKPLQKHQNSLHGY